MIDLEHFEKHINTISSSEWQTLFAQLPKLRKAKEFGKVKGLETLKDGSITSAYWVSNRIVSNTMNFIYDLNLTPIFDWTGWKQGREILENKNFDYSTLDKIELCKVLTCIVRSNRFNDGYLISCFEDGTITTILINLKKEIFK